MNNTNRVTVQATGLCTGGNYAEPLAQKVAPIDTSMSVLGQALAELDAQIAKLVRKLDPVLLYEDGASRESSSLKSPTSLLRGQIDDKASMVYDLAYVVQATIDRLEI